MYNMFNFLPLSGGALTGPLTGTTAAFSSFVETSSEFRVTNSTRIAAPADGILRFSTWDGTARLRFGATTDGIALLTNGAGTDFSRLQFGGTTSSFPALQRATAAMEVVLADNSNWANLRAGSFLVRPNTALTAGGSLLMAFTASSVSNFGVYFGSGAPGISAAKGSLYLRSDGTTTNDRAYIATDSAGAWTAITTAT